MVGIIPVAGSAHPVKILIDICHRPACYIASIDGTGGRIGSASGNGDVFQHAMIRGGCTCTGDGAGRPGIIVIAEYGFMQAGSLDTDIAKCFGSSAQNPFTCILQGEVVEMYGIGRYILIRTYN